MTLNHFYTVYHDDNVKPKSPKQWEKYGLKSFKQLLYFLGYPASDPLSYLDGFFQYQNVGAGALLQDYMLPCDRLYYILEGSVKQASVKEEQEQIFALLNDGNMATSFCDFLLGTPSAHKIVTCAKTKLLWISKQDYDKAVSLMNPEGLGQVMNNLNVYALKHMTWLQSNLYLDAKDRVKGLFETYPDIFGIFDDNDIAMHLGITRGTFCRVKKEVFRSKNAIREHEG